MLVVIACLAITNGACDRGDGRGAMGPRAGPGDTIPPLVPTAWINVGPGWDPKRLNDSVLVIEAFATWCGPCRMSAPGMVQLAEEYAASGKLAASASDADSDKGKASDGKSSAGVRFVWLTAESTAELDSIRQFIADYGIAAPVGVGADRIEIRLGIDYLPTTLVVAPGGKITWRRDGYGGPRQLKELRSAIDAAMAKHSSR